MPSRDIEEKPYASLMVVGFKVDEILRVGFKNDKDTSARNIGHGQ